MREFLLASPLSPALNAGAAASISTITASENGVVHLDRLLMGAAAVNEQAGYDSNDLNSAVLVNGLLVDPRTKRAGCARWGVLAQATAPGDLSG